MVREAKGAIRDRQGRKQGKDKGKNALKDKDKRTIKSTHG
jgi:hypothetical protein